MTFIFRKFAVPYRLHQNTLGGMRSAPGNQCGRMVMVVALMACFAACTDQPVEQSAILIRSGDRIVTLAQFERAFATARIAYSDDRDVDPAVLQQARLRFLHQLAEETILVRRADELGIAIDDAALQAAVAAIEKDYPAGEFEQMLLESAIPLSLWQDRLRARLLVENVAQVDLIDPMVITTREIEDYYRRHADAFAVDEHAPVPDALKRRIVEQLRRDKVEAAWPGWVERLRTRLGVEINWALWEQAQSTDDADDRRKEEDGS